MSRGISHFAPLPKFKEEHTMPFTKAQPDESSELRNMAYGWGKIVSRRAYGEEGPGLDIDFESIETMAVDIGQAVVRGAIEEALKTQLKLLGDHQPCPACARHCPVVTTTRTIQIRGGTITYDEPVCHCPACRRDFFPSTPELATRRARLFSDDFW
jgi:hypothetical protein